jgi:hypothetical protein
LAKSRTLEQFSEDLSKEGAGGLVVSLRKLMTALATDAETQAKLGYRRSGLRVRSGSLLGSISGGALAKAEGIGLFVKAGGLDKRGQPIRYARLQEEGGTVNAKRGRYLAIPLNPAKTPAGVARYDSPRVLGDQLFFHMKGGKAYLINKSTAKAWYRLKESVTIKARPYLRPGLKEVSQRMPDDLRRIVKLSIVGM